MTSETIGGQVITGYERGYQLHGKKEDVEQADNAYAEFKKASSNGDDAGAKAAADEFIRLATMIKSPEYVAKMKEISAKQSGRPQAVATPIPGGGQTVDPSAQNYNAKAAGTETKAPEKATPIAEGGKKPPPNALSAIIAGGAKLFGVDLEAAQGAPATAGTGNAIEAKTGDVANSRDALSSKGGGTAIVNSPTTVNNNSQTASYAKSPFRNEEGTLNKYYASRLGAY